MRALVFKLLALLGSTVFALVLLEVLLRIYNPLGQRIYGDQIVLPTNVQKTIRNDANSKIDEVVEFSNNSIGFRGPEPPRDFDDKLTVVAIGGSTTECLFLSDGNSWPGVTGSLLAPAFDPFWLNNAGLDGHSTFGHLFLLDQIIGPMRPKVAVFFIGINDLGRAGAIGRETPTPGSEPPWSIRLARHSAVVATAVNLTRQSEAKEQNLGHEQIELTALPKVDADPALSDSLLTAHRERYVPAYKERVETIVTRSRGDGIEPVLMTQPALYGDAIDPVTLVNLGSVVVSDENRVKAEQVRGRLAWELLELYNDAVRDVGRTRDVLVIDTAARLPKSSRLYYDFVHFTNEGANEVAQIVAGELCPFLAERFPDFVAGPCPSLAPHAVDGDSNLRAAVIRMQGVLDLGNEASSNSTLVGNGWLEPESEHGVGLRRSRGRRSRLSVPVVDMSDHTFVFRARAELLDVTLTARVEINGHNVGTMKPSDDWQEYAFDVSKDSLVFGLNTATLNYSDTPRTLDPGFRGRNSSIALDWIRFEPARAK